MDEAALRRLTKRIFIGLPDGEARAGLIKRTLSTVKTSLSSSDFQQIIHYTEGYSSADLSALCKEAAMEPVREIPPNQILKIKGESAIRSINLQDFMKALRNIRPSVSKQSLLEYAIWHKAASSIM